MCRLHAEAKVQVLSSDIRALRKKGETQLADEIEKSATAIRRHVDRELARTSVAPGMSLAANTLVVDTAGRVIFVSGKWPPKVCRLLLSVSTGDVRFAPRAEAGCHRSRIPDHAAAGTSRALRSIRSPWDSTIRWKSHARISRSDFA